MSDSRARGRRTHSARTGHFDFCSAIDTTTAEQSCSGNEGAANFAQGVQPADQDDNFCFGPSSTPPPLLYQTTGCEDSNDPGFDGTSFQSNYWPDGLTATTAATPFLFSSPMSGANGSTSFGTPYATSALETDLPRIEDVPGGQDCIRFIGDHGSTDVGMNCTNPPLDDHGNPAAFYPFFSSANVGPGSSCQWGAGADWSSGQPGASNYGGSSAQFGPSYFTAYWLFRGHGASQVRVNNFNSAASGGDGTTPSVLNPGSNPC